MAVSVSLNRPLRNKINMAVLQTNSRAADFWVRQRAFTVKTLLDFTRWAKHSKPESASNQTRELYWQDQSTRHQKKYFPHWFAVINCGFPQKISNNITLVLLSYVYLTFHTPCAERLSSPMGSCGQLERQHSWASHWKQLLKVCTALLEDRCL